MKKKSYTTFAAIHLGSEKISMQIVEYRSTDRCKIVERCERSVHIGEETFKNKNISFATVNEICDILLGFKILMKECGAEEYSLQATTAVREALNQPSVLDQIYCRTGLKVDVVDLPMEIYTTYIAVRNTLKKEKISTDREGILLMDISSGGLGLVYIRDEKIEYQQDFHVGAIRIKESYERNKRESTHFNRALTEFLSSTFSPISKELGVEKVRYLVLSGTETQLLLKVLGLEPGQDIYRIKAETFHDFFANIQAFNVSQLMQVYALSENAAELVLPITILYEQLLNLIPAEEIIITSDRFIDGIQLLHIGRKTDEDLCKEWEKELISLFHCLGSHFHYDKAHACQVESLALAIFDKVAKDYGMGAKERLLLRGTALLHDVGKFVNLRSHSRYSYDLIISSDLLGFSEEDRRIIALASYYSAHQLFETGNKRAPEVPKRLVSIVGKLAAIVRLADALDRSYLQKVKRCQVSIRDKVLTIAVDVPVNFTLEEWTFANKADAFTAVYGLKVQLERIVK